MNPKYKLIGILLAVGFLAVLGRCVYDLADTAVTTYVQKRAAGVPGESDAQ